MFGVHVSCLPRPIRDVKVERLEARVVGEVAMYGGVCRTARDELKRGFDTRQREIAHRRSLEKVKTRHPQNRQQIACILCLLSGWESCVC